MSLYDEIGREFIEKAVREFYTRAVQDPIIGHFFFKVDVESLILKQIAFTCKLLGEKGGAGLKAAPLKSVHGPLGIRGPHFARRQKLMGMVLDDMGLRKEWRDAWLHLEFQLKPLIISKASAPS